MAMLILAKRLRRNTPSFRSTSNGRSVAPLRECPPLYVVIIRGKRSEVLGIDLTWDDAELLAGTWNRFHGDRQTWAWIEPIAAQGRKGVAA